MAQTLSGPDALAALLGRAVSDADAAPAAAQPQELTCRVPHDLLLDQLYQAIDDLVPYAPDELRPVLRLLWGWLNPADTGAAPSARAMTRRVRGVELAWTMTVILGPEMRRLAELNQPGRYLAPFDGILRSDVQKARKAYCSAIVAALDDDPPNVIEYWQNEGGRLISRFRYEMQRLYLHDSKGLEAQIKDLGDAVVALVALRSERGGHALAQRAADAEVGVPMTTPAGPWFLQQGLINELNGIRSDSFAIDVTERYVRFSGKLQGLAAAAQILATRERLSWLADQPWVATDTVTRVRGYVTELGTTALTQAENAIARRKLGEHVEAASWQRMAATSASGITTRAEFKQDVDSLADTMKLQEEVKGVAAGVAIAAVTALTAGAAGAAAGMALATVVDTSTVFGALVVSGGVLATRVVWETVVARSGSELLLGPDSIKGSTFAEDLGWQALQTVVTKVVLYGCGDIFKAIEKAGERGKAAAKIAEVAVEQITTFGFGEVQHLIKTGKTRTLRESVVAAVGQAAGAGVVAVGGMLNRSFVDRIGGARGSLSADGERALVAVERDRTALLRDFEPVRTGTASDAEFLAWAQRAAGVWNRYVDVVRGLQEGAAKQAALGQLTLAKGAIELRLAELGISATLTVPDGVPMFEGLLPGLVAVSEDGRPVLDDAIPADRRRPTDVVDGVLGEGPDGRRRLFLPADALPDAPPNPARLAHLPEANVVPTEAPEVPPAMDPVAAIGLERLRGVAPKNWREILGEIADGQVESFLSLLAHEELANPASLRPRLRYLATLGSDAESLEFARMWGPELALWLQKRCGTRGKEFRRDLRRADALLEAEPDATRQALIDKMMAARTTEAMRRIIGTGKPPRPRAAPQTAENLGVDRNSREWKLLRKEVEAAFPGLSGTQRVALADFRQAYRKARTPFMRVLTPEQRRQMVLEFDDLLVTAGLRPAEGQLGDHRPANNWRGKYAEFLFIPDGMDQQTRWYKRVPNAGNRADRSDLDGHREEGGVHIFLEFKSDEIHDEKQTPGRQAALARKYFDEAKEDVNDNLPLGSKYYLWFMNPPKGGQAAIDAMRAILIKPGGPITDVFFGPQTPAPLVFK
jgi:hypothetical protein